jgi:hypothetical protein
MNKQDIIKRLTNTQLEPHDREQLQQLLHYLEAEGLNSTTTTTNNTSKQHKQHKRRTTKQQPKQKR